MLKFIEREQVEEVPGKVSSGETVRRCCAGNCAVSWNDGLFVEVQYRNKRKVQLKEVADCEV